MARILLSYERHTAPDSGSGVHGHHLVDALRAQGHALSTLERRSDERLRRFPRTPGGMRAALAQADCIYARVAARRFDLGLLEWNRRTARLPVVVELNAPPEETLAYGNDLVRLARVRARRFAYHRMVGRAEALVCVSRNLAAHVGRRFPEVPEHVAVVPNGGTPAASPAGSREGFHVAWAGSSRRPWQAVDLVREAARRLARRVPGGAVHLFDRDAATGAEGPGWRLHPVRSHAEVRTALRGMDAALCLYREPAGTGAGFYFSPIKLFEAMGTGLPVVASRLGQIAEVVEPGRTGWLVGDDAEEIAARLESLARDRAGRRAMGERALADVRSAYTWAHTGRGVETVIRAVLERQADRAGLEGRVA